MDEGDPSCRSNQWDKHILHRSRVREKDSSRRRTARKRQEKRQIAVERDVNRNILEDPRASLAAEHLLNN